MPIEFTPRVKEIDKQYKKATSVPEFSEDDMRALLHFLGIALADLVSCIHPAQQDQAMTDHFTHVHSVVKQIAEERLMKAIEEKGDAKYEQ